MYQFADTEHEEIDLEAWGSRQQHMEPVKKCCNVKEYNMEIKLEEYTSEPCLMQDSQPNFRKLFDFLNRVQKDIIFPQNRNRKP